MTEHMRVAIGQFSELTHERLTFARQLGVSGVQLNTPLLPADAGYWQLSDLLWLKKRVEDYGLHLEALENVPIQFLDTIMLGLPGRDEKIEKYKKTIHNLGKAGIPILGYNWMPNGVWRTSRAKPGRGGALVTAFEMSQVDQAEQFLSSRALALIKDRTFTAEEMWDNYVYFMKAVLPAAEEAGVRLALHPDDPPVPMLGGVARLFHSFEGFKRAMDAFPSPNSGIDFCLGCFSEMGGGKGLIEAIRYFGERGKILYVHFRDVQGSADSFQECFLGEGNYDPVEVMCTLKAVGFTGFILDDHVPHMIDDTEWNHRGHAHATGYIAGLLAAINTLC